MFVGVACVSHPIFLGFPGGSAGKEFACNVREPGLIPRLGRSPGEGKGYPLQYSDLEIRDHQGSPSCDLLWRLGLERCNEGESKAYSGPYFSLTGGILITGSG